MKKIGYLIIGIDILLLIITYYVTTGGNNQIQYDIWGREVFKSKWLAFLGIIQIPSIPWVIFDTIIFGIILIIGQNLIQLSKNK